MTLKCKFDKKNFWVALITGIYLSFVTSNVEWNTSVALFFCIKIVLFTAAIYYAVIPNLKKIKLQNNQEKLTKKDYVKWATIIFFFLFIALLVYHTIAYEQLVDYQDHYRDAINNTRGDWHPYIYVFLFHVIPTFLIKSPIMSCIYQGIFILICLLYMCSFLYRYGVTKGWITCILMLFLLNPTFGVMSMAPIKDIPYSYCLLIMSLILIDIYFTKGKWLKNTKNYLLFMIVSFGIMFFRHNGIATFLAIYLALFLFEKNTRKLVTASLIAFIFLRFVFIPDLYQQLNIYKVNVTYSELTDPISMQMMHIYNNSDLDEKLEKELLTFYTEEDMKKLYVKDNFYAIKYSSNHMEESFHTINNNIGKFLNLWWTMVKEEPVLAMQSYLYTTNHMWKVSLNNYDAGLNAFWYTFSPRDIDNTLLHSLRSIYLYNQEYLCTFPYSFIFPMVGSGFFVIIFSIMVIIRCSNRKLSSLVPFVPVVSNMLLMLLVIPGKETRFIYANVICSIPLLIYMFIIINKEFRIK